MFVLMLEATFDEHEPVMANVVRLPDVYRIIGPCSMVAYQAVPVPADEESLIPRPYARTLTVCCS